MAKSPPRDRAIRPGEADSVYTPQPFGVWRPIHPPMPVAHTHSEIELNFICTGRVTYLHGGVRRTVEPGRLALFWAGIPHQTIAHGVTGEGVWVFVPLVWLLQWKLPRDLAGRLLAGEFFEFATPMEMPERWLADFQSDDPECRSVLLLELQTTLARLALSLPKDAPQAVNSAESNLGEGGDEHIPRVTAFVATHYQEENLSIESIAHTVKLHPNYLMQLFHRRCHMSLWEYVSRLRVSHAQRLLVTTNLRVLDVALESGFGSLAPFYRSFAHHTGTNPLAFRRQQRVLLPRP